MVKILDSLRTRVLLLLGLVLLVVLTVASIRAFEQRDADVAHAMERLQFHAQIIIGKQRDAVQHTLNFLSIMTETMEMTELGKNPRCSAILADYLANDPRLANLFVTDLNGDVVCNATRAPTRINLADRDYIRKALQSREAVIGAAAFGRATQRWILPFGKSFRDASGKVIGVMGVSFDLAWVNRELATTPLLPGMRLGLIDAQGTVVARYPHSEEWLGRNVSDSQVFKRMQELGGDGTAELPTSEGVVRIFTFKHFAASEAGPITIWMSLPRAAVIEPANQQLLMHAAITLLLMLFTFCAAWYGGNLLLVQPIDRIAGAARRLSQGDYRARSGLPYSGSEIGELARSFDEMALALASNNEVLRLNRALRVIGACNKALVYAASETDLLNEVCRLLVEEGGYRMVMIAFVEPDAAQSVRPIIYRWPGSDDPENANISWCDAASTCCPVGMAIKTGLPQVNQRFETDACLAPWREAELNKRYRSCSTFPFKDKSRVFGVLAIYSEDPVPFNADEAQLLTELSDNIAFGMLALRSDAARQQAEQELSNYRAQLEILVDERTQALKSVLAEAEAANRAKSVFLSNMSHELRTPLNSVIGFSRMMARSTHLDEREKRNLEIINRSGNHLLTLINDVLELSKIEAGHVTLAESPTDVAEMAHEIVDMLKPRAEQGGLALNLELKGLPEAVQVDTVKLRQILINLLGNAIKFTRQGSVGLTVKGLAANDGMVRLDFEVRDTGIGIAPENQQRIFEPFVQMVTHATTAGTGLGLAITRQYLRMLHSKLELDSTPDLGSCFRFALLLPVVKVQGVAQVARGGVLGPEAGAMAGQGKRILVVEDNADSRQLLLQFLQPLGFALAEAGDGAAAIARTEQFQPELIVMDWRMPVMDGLEATRRIRALPLPVQPKILMLTASAFEEERQHAFAAGIDAFLRKPLQEREFVAAVEKQLGVKFEYKAEGEDRGGERSAEQNRAARDVSLSAEMLAMLSEEQRQALCVAVEELNRAKVNAVLAEIARSHPAIAASIGHLADAFRYRELWKLLRGTT